MEVGDTLAYIHTNREDKIQEAKINIRKAYKISEESTNIYEHILGII